MTHCWRALIAGSCGCGLCRGRKATRHLCAFLPIPRRLFMTLSSTSVHRGPSSRPSASQSADMRAQIKLWLRTIDALLVAIEQTALEVRGLGDTTMSLLNDLRGTPGNGGSGSGVRGLRNEL